MSSDTAGEAGPDTPRPSEAVPPSSAKKRPHVRHLLRLADADADDALSSAEYRALLQLIGVWDKAPQYTDARWGQPDAEIQWADLGPRNSPVCN